MKQGAIRNPDLLFPGLSYQIIGCAIEVFNKIGFGRKESIYQKALHEALCCRGIIVNSQEYAPVFFNGKEIGKSYLDFVVNG